MKTLTLKESQAPYNVALDESLLAGEVVILEKDGQPVAALVPLVEYEAFHLMNTSYLAVIFSTTSIFNSTALNSPLI